MKNSRLAGITLLMVLAWLSLLAVSAVYQWSIWATGGTLLGPLALLAVVLIIANED